MNHVPLFVPSLGLGYSVQRRKCGQLFSSSAGITVAGNPYQHGCMTLSSKPHHSSDYKIDGSIE
jgi:hypothetical protein